MTLEQYISNYGFVITDFSEKEIDSLKEELAAINSGKIVLDGVMAEKERQKVNEFYRMQF